MVDATLKLERVALQWRKLAERRRSQYIELYRSGRWRHYYTDQDFLKEMRRVFAIARRWEQIAPKPEDLHKPAAKPTAPARQYALPPAA